MSARIKTDQARPIFIIGRQHCGNTMLATMLGRHPELHAFTGEGNFFEHDEALRTASFDQQVERIAHEITHGADPVLGEDTQADIVEYIHHQCEKSGPYQLYVAGKAYLTEQNGAARWVQKATSYVFHAERILQALPQAQLLFLARNPLDLAASVQRRGYFENHIGRTLWGWNIGVRRALELQSRWPDAVRVFRYEDLVRRTHETIDEISAFCDLEFDARCTKVQHVNPSENPYVEEGRYRSPSVSRLFYYPDVLDDTDEVAVRYLSSSGLLAQLYPDLPEAPRRRSWRAMARAGRLALYSLAGGARQHGKMMITDPEHAIRRVRERLFT